MKKNMGTIDVAVRIVIALLFIVLYATNVVTGALGIILIILAVVFILTGIFRFCPLYIPFNINTGKKEEKKPE
jgi:hypothetical protein